MAKHISDRYHAFHQKASETLVEYLTERGKVKRGSLFNLVANFEGFEYVVEVCSNSLPTWKQRKCRNRVSRKFVRSYCSFLAPPLFCLGTVS